ncbi:hypothetical protein [Azospirillum sp.]|uniref:hypothetical protein n=1 Tax=Azospirillum sp. TaxID=34012 RepID=UPI002D3BAAE7|nr:hypothetical protein [Azospirillum sp.]HYD67053.1 hypothetical protein [Azospirillum sp.]
MSVQTFNPTDLSQSTTNWAVAQRMVGPFAPHAQVVPNMTVAVDPGYLLSGTTLTEVNAQSTPAITPPASGFRIDRVVVDRTTGAVSVIAGTPNSLTPPALTAGKLPVARVFLESTTTAITNDSIVDERALFDLTPDSAQVICRAHRNGVDQTGIPHNTFVQVTLTATDFNVGNAFNMANSRFAPSIAGYYMVRGQVTSTLTTGAAVAVALRKNGSDVGYGNSFASTPAACIASVTEIIYFNGVSDFVEMYGYQGTGSTGSFWGNNAYTSFVAQRIG